MTSAPNTAGSVLNATSIIPKTVSYAAVDPKLTAGYDPSKAPANPPAAPAGGVLNATYTPAMAKAVKAEASTYAAQKNLVDDNSMSAYHLGKITGEDSPLMQQAATTGLKFANKRGLLNTSIAAGATQDAMIRGATPLALQDAGTYATSNLADQAAINRSREFNASAENTASLQNAQAGTQVNLTNSGALNAKGQLDSSNFNSQSLADKDAASRITIQKMQSDASKDLAGIENQVKLQLQKIQSDTALTAEARRAASSQVIAEANNASNQAISQGDNATKLLLQASTNAANLGLAELDVNTKLQIAGMDQSSKEALAKLGIESDQLIRTNASAAGLMQQAMVGLAQISSSTMDGPAKQTATDNMLNTLKNSLDAIASYGSIDLSKFFPAVEPTSGESTAGNGIKYPYADIGVLDYQT